MNSFAQYPSSRYTPEEAAKLTHNLLVNLDFERASELIRDIAFKTGSVGSSYAHHWYTVSRRDLTWGSSHPTATIETDYHTQPLIPSKVTDGYLIRYIDVFFRLVESTDVRGRKFFLQVFLNSPDIQPYINAVLDAYIYYNKGGDVASEITDLLEAEFNENRKSKVFEYINPFSAKLLSLVQSERLKKEMMLPFLEFRHQYFNLIMKNDSDLRYTDLLETLKSILSPAEFVQIVRSLLVGFFNLKSATARQDKAIRSLFYQFASVSPTVSRFEFLSFFNDQFFSSQVFVKLEQSPIEGDFEAILKRIHKVDPELAAQFVVQHIKNNPSRLDSLLGQKLIERYVIVMDPKKYLNIIVNQVQTETGTRSREYQLYLKSKYFEKGEEVLSGQASTLNHVNANVPRCRAAVQHSL